MLAVYKIVVVEESLTTLLRAHVRDTFIFRLETFESIGIVCSVCVCVLNVVCFGPNEAGFDVGSPCLVLNINA